MIFKCECSANDYDIQMLIIRKWLWFPNDYDIQMQMISKCEWYSNANYSQMLILLN